jgi:hypothetical protein
MASSSIPSDADAEARLSLWQRFWHVPLRAERLALMRILLGLALLVDQALQTWPYFLDLFGPNGLAPAGLHEPLQFRRWRLTTLVFYTDDPTILYAVFAAWVSVAALWTIGWHTRLMGVALWLLTMCFLNRNPYILNSGDRLLQVGLFLLMLSPCGKALSVDAWLHRRRTGEKGPTYTEAWPVRLVQIQLCTIYLSTGLLKLMGDWGPGQPFRMEGTWWDGTTIHDVLNFVCMSRYSYAQLPVPFWITAPLTYLTVWWEALFPLLVLFRVTRTPALFLGVAIHLGIYATVEVGGFSFFVLSFYGVWVSCSVWQRWDQRRARGAAPPAETPGSRQP